MRVLVRVLVAGSMPAGTPPGYGSRARSAAVRCRIRSSSGELLRLYPAATKRESAIRLDRSTPPHDEEVSSIIDVTKDRLATHGMSLCVMPSPPEAPPGRHDASLLSPSRLADWYGYPVCGAVTIRQQYSAGQIFRDRPSNLAATESGSLADRRQLLPPEANDVTVKEGSGRPSSCHGPVPCLSASSCHLPLMSPISRPSSPGRERRGGTA